MSDIKSVLSLLCQHLNWSINVAMKPEYFRLAKFNSPAESVSVAFWKALNILSYYAAKQNQIQVDFQQCDLISATKLYFAYLKYPAVEFYALSKRSKNSRPLLLAFAWILGTQNVLSIIVRINLSNGVLGKECSTLSSLEVINPTRKTETDYEVAEQLTSQIDHVLYLNGKTNYAIKGISELIAERSKLASKAHVASTNVGGVPHLSVSEAALVKRISTVDKATRTSRDAKYLKQFASAASLSDTQMKWLKKEHVFFEWMATVVEERDKLPNRSLEDTSWNDEVSKFARLLNSVTQERLEALSSKEESCRSEKLKPKCVSRLLRVRGSRGELQDRLTELSAELNRETETLRKKKERLSEQLEEILRSIPCCVQVS